MTYDLVDPKVLLVQLLRPLLTGVRVTSTPQSSDPLPVIVLSARSVDDVNEEFVQGWMVTLMTTAETRADSWATAVNAHQQMVEFGEKVTGIPGIGWVGLVTPRGKPTEYAGGSKLYQHIASYRITVRPDITT